MITSTRNEKVAAALRLKKRGSRRRRVEGMAEVTAERTNIRRLLGK